MLVTCSRIARVAYVVVSVFAAVVLFDLFKPAPPLPCDLMVLGSVTRTSAIVLVNSCEKVAILQFEERDIQPDLEFSHDDGVGFLGSYEFKDLKPNAAYEVRYKSQLLTFRTFPDANDSGSDTLLLTLGSCSCVTMYPWSSLEAAYNKIMSLNPKFSLFLGDNTYVDIHGALPWYRIPFEVAHRRVFTDSSVLKLMKSIPSFTMFDDHEIENDFVGGLLHPHASSGLQTYLKYWGQRNPGRSTDFEKLYYNFSYGRVAAVFVIESRLHYRKDQGTMLSPQQTSHLLDWLSSVSKEDFAHIILASSMSWSADGDGEDFYVTRNTVFSHITKLGLSNVLILSGDMHYGAAYKHAFGRVLEFSASPIQALAFWPDENPRNNKNTGYERLFIHGGPRFFIGALNLTMQRGEFMLYSWSAFSPRSEPVLIESLKFLSHRSVEAGEIEAT